MAIPFCNLEISEQNRICEHFGVDPTWNLLHLGRVSDLRANLGTSVVEEIAAPDKLMMGIETHQNYKPGTHIYAISMHKSLHMHKTWFQYCIHNLQVE